MFIISSILAVVAGLLAVAVAVFFFEILIAFVFPSRTSTFKTKPSRTALIIPAHNESHGILATLTGLKPQLRPTDRLLVVADNCTDDTAAIARQAGAEIIERNDPANKGKGYALDFALKHLAANPPDAVIIVDADCRLSDGAVDTMAQACMATGRPVQILDLMTAPESSPINYRVAEFAWRVRNWVRPLGLAALGLPCPLMGTGMAFPWALIHSVNLASGALTEDRELGLVLAQAGKAPLFCPQARVTSHFPWSAEGAQSQRRRWEEGNIRMILRKAPLTLVRALGSGNLPLLALALDAMVPPLSLLVLLVTGMFIVSGVAVLLGAAGAAFTISSVSLAALIAAVGLAWLKYGRDVLPFTSVFSVAGYVLGKLPLYRQIFSRRAASSWVRTDRGKH